jgi:hypothetical protein
MQALREKSLECLQKLRRGTAVSGFVWSESLLWVTSGHDRLHEKASALHLKGEAVERVRYVPKADIPIIV